jgi:hypothetical protein
MEKWEIGVKYMLELTFMKLKIFFLLLITYHLLLISPAFAVVDPLSSPNNKFGIHIISPTPDEINPATTLVNSSGGDWGYITVLIESKDRSREKWQAVFDDFRRRHLIPIVRLATQPEGGYWKKPYEGEEEAWAGFLDNLNWPTKNRYIIVYNEPNHGQEWGGAVDPKNYAQVLDKTITALKKKSEDFFILNAGLDVSTPQEPPNYMDALTYLKQMNEEVPGIFNKLDGWSSHSYPNPGFVGSPSSTGRGTVRTWFWELQTLRDLGLTKNLPVFITETGWKHSDGVVKNSSFPSPETVAGYYQNAFTNAWNSSRIVAITPFLLSYQEAPFDQFSFKKITGQKQHQRILGAKFPEYHPQYDSVFDLPKLTGFPLQDQKATLKSGEIYSSLVASQDYNIAFTFKNTGQSIWNERQVVKLVALESASELNIIEAEIPKNTKIEPQGEYTFNLRLKAPESGKFSIKLALLSGDEQIQLDKPLEFTTEVKTPVMLQIKAKLKWKDNSSGDYILGVKGAAGTTEKSIPLSSEGLSEELEARYLLPGYKFEFTLSRPFYQPVTIERPVSSDLNTLDFGTLEPDFGSAFLKPTKLWGLLPFTN